MQRLRRYLLAAAAQHLRMARPHLHQVPDLQEAYETLSRQLGEPKVCSTLLGICRLWWYARCVERCAHHAVQAERCRR